MRLNVNVVQLFKSDTIQYYYFEAARRFDEYWVQDAFFQLSALLKLLNSSRPYSILCYDEVIRLNHFLEMWVYSR